MKYDLIFIIFSFLVSNAYAQPGSIREKGDASGKSVIEFQVKIHDFGIIETGEGALYNFVFKNTGSNPVVISNVRSSCGCTVPRWPKDPILPGRTDSISVEYNTKIRGAFNKIITVYTNAADPVVELTIKGNVTKKI